MFAGCVYVCSMCAAGTQEHVCKKHEYETLYTVHIVKGFAGVHSHCSLNCLLLSITKHERFFSEFNIDSIVYFIINSSVLRTLFYKVDFRARTSNVVCVIFCHQTQICNKME